MDSVLMHKNVPVVSLVLDAEMGFIQRIAKVYHSEHLPVGISVRRGIVDRAALNEWWTDRSIPFGRNGVPEALEVLGLSNPKALLARCYGLSLSDSYWIQPGDRLFRWEDVHFFAHAFSDDVGDALFGKEEPHDPVRFVSPDSTTDGFLKKRWKILDGKRCLIQGGSNPFWQQPFNEVIASKIMDRLGIRHVSYSLCWVDGYPYSICEDFVDENTELVPAWRILMTQKKKNDVSVYQHFLHCCEDLGIPGARDFLDQMMTVDYLLANEDRHFNNFGALRDSESLKWLGMAPIYDSGSCLGYDELSHQIQSGKEVECKPFKKHHEEQIRLVHSSHWLDESKLDGLKEVIRDVLSEGQAKSFMDLERIEAIGDSLERRVQSLKRWIQERQNGSEGNNAASTKDDVLENVAEDYNR